MTSILLKDVAAYSRSAVKEAGSQTIPMNFNIAIGYLIGLAIISAISAVFLKLGARILGGKTATYPKAFGISFASFLLALFAQMFLDDMHSTSVFVEVSPGIVFFLASWLLNARFIKYGEIDTTSYGKSFLVSIIQCATLFVVGIVFSFVLIAFLSSFGSSLKH